MAMIKCKECGKEITDNSTRCCHCGAENLNAVSNTVNNSNSSIFAGLIALLVVGLIAWGIVSLISKPVEKEGKELLNVFGISQDGNDLIYTEKSKAQTKDDFMEWMGFEKVEN